MGNQEIMSPSVQALTARCFSPFGGRDLIQLAIVVAITALVYQFLKHAMLVIENRWPPGLFAVLGGVFLLGLAHARWTYAGLSPAYRILLSGTALVLAFYCATAYWLFPSDAEWQIVMALYVSQAVAVCSGIGALWRPVLALVPGVYVLLAKAWTKLLAPLPELSATDYMPLVDCVAFLSLGLIAFRVLSRQWLFSRSLSRVDEEAATRMLFLIAVGIHLGNYFHSAMAKLLLPGGAILWVFDNATHNLIPVTLDGGFLPIGHWPVLSAWTYDTFAKIVSLSNAIILIGQLAAVVAVLRARWIIGITVFYDFTHVVIFLVSGILFWKWILLNGVIVAAAAKLRGSELSRSEIVAASLAVVLGTTCFFAARLGWYDTSAYNRASIYAVTKSGQEVAVPTNYFLGASVSFAQMRLGSPEPDQHLPTLTWGSTTSPKIVRAARACDFTHMPLGNPYPFEASQFTQLIRRHHQTMLSHVDADGHFAYDWYPHHIWSNPFLFRPFATLDIRSILAYRYVVEAVCLDFSGGKMRRRVLHRSEALIEVGNE
ncbi:MAG TPA: hypothetical protein VNK52_04400 [Hyphomicrobiaceae bacterium]|nr:hypothetical protein [Hyphomicrobiaceae bacterium]